MRCSCSFSPRAQNPVDRATGVLGGMGTAGLVPWFCGYDDGEKVIARGLAEHEAVFAAE